MIRIGVLGTANIAFRRMIPAILKNKELEFAGVAVAAPSEWTEKVEDEEAFISAKLDKGYEFAKKFGGRIYEGYEVLLKDESVDAVYIPLPPSHHEYWSKKALEYGKHVLVEKPFTLNEKTSREVVDLALEKGLAFCENYGFVLHPQMAAMKSLLEDGSLGEFRLMRASFTFPFRDAADFRYKKEYGGGALLDAGGYVIKAAETVLGEDIKLTGAVLHDSERFDVDMYGDATFVSGDGRSAQISFGMDNAYSCSMELYGATGNVVSGRVYTAPDDFVVKLAVNKGGQAKTVEIEPFDQFLAVVDRFVSLIGNEAGRRAVGREIIRHAALVDEVMEKAVRVRCK